MIEIQVAVAIGATEPGVRRLLWVTPGWVVETSMDDKTWRRVQVHGRVGRFCRATSLLPLPPGTIGILQLVPDPRTVRKTTVH